MATVYQYTVSGKSHFPVDMLRYDSAYPARSEDVDPITVSPDHPDYFETRSVTVRSNRPPTVDRWRSFGWVVSDQRKWKV